jgi:hypothetical protein
MLTVLLTIGVLAAAVTLLALRILLVRNGEFRGTCASNNPFLKTQLGECLACGKTETESCEYRESRDGHPIPRR